MQKREMATVENIRNAVTSAVAGAKYGIHRGNQVVGAAKAIDSFMGGQAPRGGRVGAAIEGYAGGQRADALRQQFARENPRDAGGPRTAAFYAYRYRRPGVVARNDPSAGTPSQHAALNRLRRQQEQIRLARTTPRVGRFRDQAPPTEEDFLPRAEAPIDVPRPMVDAAVRQYASTPEIAERAISRANRPTREGINEQVRKYASTPAKAEEAIAKATGRTVRSRGRQPPPWATIKI